MLKIAIGSHGSQKLLLEVWVKLQNTVYEGLSYGNNTTVVKCYLLVSPFPMLNQPSRQSIQSIFVTLTPKEIWKVEIVSNLLLDVSLLQQPYITVENCIFQNVITCSTLIKATWIANPNFYRCN